MGGRSEKRKKRKRKSRCCSFLSLLYSTWYFNVYPNFSLMKSFGFVCKLFYWFKSWIYLLLAYCRSDHVFINCWSYLWLWGSYPLLELSFEVFSAVTTEDVALTQFFYRKIFLQKWRKLTCRMKGCSDILSLWLDSLYNRLTSCPTYFSACLSEE